MKKYRLFKGVGLLATALSTMALNVISDWLFGINSVLVKIIFSMVIFISLVFVVWSALRTKAIVIDNYRMDRLDDANDQDEHAREGLIVMLSKYNRVPRDEQEKKSFIKLLEEGTYDQLDFQNSNLGHLVKTITSHKTKLRHCWVITTENTGNTTEGMLNGTHAYYKSITNYLKTVLPGVEFHQEKIIVTEDSAVTRKVRETVNRILSNNKTPKDTITDVTGGTKSMTLGATLACLQGDRDLQIIGTDYDTDGNILFDRSFVLLCRFDVKNIE